LTGVQVWSAIFAAMRNAFIFLGVLILAGCSSKVKQQATGYTQGTTYSIIYFNDGSKDCQYQIDSLLLDFDRVLSTYQESSYISKWNRVEVKGAEQPAMFKEVVSAAKRISNQTNGAFDITVSPLMKFWFERDWKVEELDSTDVDSIMRFVGMDKVLEDGKYYVKTDSSVLLDVNAIAQGYSVDVVSRYLESEGVFNYLVEIGGEIRASGSKPNDEPWTVGIDKPSEGNTERELAMSVELKNRALATSGNYRKFVEINGQKFGHTLDAKTGYPAKTDVLSATVIAANCMDADAYATALMAMGFESSKDLVESTDDIDAILIYSDASGNINAWDSREAN
jgi:thiamine biosynthesis lipoprotein